MCETDALSYRKFSNGRIHTATKIMKRVCHKHCSEGPESKLHLSNFYLAMRECVSVQKPPLSGTDVYRMIEFLTNFLKHKLTVSKHYCAESGKHRRTSAINM